MCNVSRMLRRLALLVMAICLCGCLEVDEEYRISRDGKTDARIVIKVDPQYEALVMPDLERKLRSELPPEMKVDASQRIDGKASIVIEGKGVELSTIAASDQPMHVSTSPAGFLKKRFVFNLSTAKAPDILIPHRVRITLPGSIEQTNGRKVESDTVEFDVTRARRGTKYQATSTAFALSFGPGGSAATSAAAVLAGAGSNVSALGGAWLLPASLASIVLGAVALVVGWFRRRSAPSPSPLSMSQQSPATHSLPDMRTPSIAQIFCNECGSPQPADRLFCTGCGAKLS